MSRRQPRQSLRQLVAAQAKQIEDLQRRLDDPSRHPTPTSAELTQRSAEQARQQVGAPSPTAARKKVHVITVDMQVPQDTRPQGELVEVPPPTTALAKREPPSQALVKSLIQKLAPETVERLAFEVDPNASMGYEGVYIPLRKLVPDDVKKRVAIAENLVACIVGGRAFQMSHFGRPRPDRFAFGFVVQPTAARNAKMTVQEREEIRPKIDAAVKRLYHCGDDEGWDNSDRCTLSEWLFQSARSAVTLGRLATEVIYKNEDGQERFKGFRPTDPGTVYRAAPRSEQVAAVVREQSKTLLENVCGHRLDHDETRFKVRPTSGSFWNRWQDGEFRWVQVIEGQPRQVFTDDEMKVRNLYPVLDVETNGYPVTPIDSALKAICTRLNITTYNENYFLHGRASRGMLVIQSEDVDERVVQDLKQHLQANVNGAKSAWRMPVFGVGKEDDVRWVPFDQGTKDMEFQYLSDNNAREILSSFQMSPEEIPGYAHLSRGTANQSLSESNREYQLEAHRDLGVRPLIAFFEDFVNTELFPLVAPDLVGVCEVKLLGLEADTAEKEAVRIQQDLVHSTYNEVLHRTEKKPIGADICGDVPLNQQWQATADKLALVGHLRAQLMGDKAAEEDIRWNYLRDPFWFQQQQWLQGLLGAVPQMFGPQAVLVLGPRLIKALFLVGDDDAKQLAQLMAQQVQQQLMAQQQAAAGPGGAQGASGGQEEGGGDQQAQAEGGDDPGAAQEQQGGEEDLTRSIDQAIAALGKGEKHLPPAKRRILQQHRRFVRDTVGSLDRELGDLFGSFNPEKN